MTIYFDNGVWTDANGKEIPDEEAYALTGLLNTESVDEYTEAKAVRSAEQAEKAGNN
jgi:hypothetical protein